MRLICVRVELRQTSAELSLFSLRGLGVHILGNALHAQCVFFPIFPLREFLPSKPWYFGISVDRNVSRTVQTADLIILNETGVGAYINPECGLSLALFESKDSAKRQLRQFEHSSLYTSYF